MESLIIKQGKYTPSVSFDTDNNVFDISGESYSCVPRDFYEPVVRWLREYLVANQSPVTVNIQLDYFNTSTYSPLCEILQTFERYQLSMGAKVTINWFTSQNDKDLINDIQFIKEGFENLQFNVLPVHSAA